MLKKVKGFLFSNNTVKQTLAKNTFWLVVSNVGGRFIKAGIIVYAARILGVAEWGSFSYAVTIVAFMTVFVDFGMNSILIRETSRTEDPIERAKILSTSFFIKLVLLSLGIAIISLIVPHFIEIENVKRILPIVAFILVFDSLREFGSALNRTYEKMEVEALVFITTNILIVGFGYIFLNLRPTVKSFAFAYAAGTGLGMMFGFFILRDKLKNVFSNFTKKLVKPIMLSSWPFAISGVLGILMINTDILLIGKMLSAKEVGLYSAADRVIQILYLIPSVISTSVLPLFSKLAHKDNQKMRQTMEKIIGVTLVAAIPISIGGAILGKDIIEFLFGGGYVGATLSLQILVLTLMINFTAVILSGAIFAYDNQKSLIWTAALGGISNVILDLILIPKFGIAGSAMATFLAIIMSNTYLWIKMKKINYFKIYPKMNKAIMATAIMAVATFFMTNIHINLLINVGISIVIYFGALYLLKESLMKDLFLIFKIKI